MPTTHARRPATGALTQFPETEDRLIDLAQQVQAGLLDEQAARNDALAAVYASGLIESTVSWWAGSRSMLGAHHRADLLFEAQSWVIRAVTGWAVGARMREGVARPASLLDLGRVAGGASPVGYLRTGLVREMRKLVRTVTRSVDPVAVDEGSQDERGSVRVWGGAGPFGDLEGLRAHLVSDWFWARTSRGVRPTERALAQAHGLQAFYDVPAARRPPERSHRELMATVLAGDGGSALRSLTAAVNRGGSGGVLVDLWADFDEGHAQAIASSPRATQVAHVLAQVALAPWPKPGRSHARRLRIRLASRFAQTGLDAALGTQLAAAFLVDEFEPGAGLAVAGEGTGWAALARPLTRTHPHLLGEDLQRVRTELLAILQPDDEPSPSGLLQAA